MTSKANNSLTLGFVGDICFGKAVQLKIEKNGPDFPFSAVRNMLTSMDIMVGNLECCLKDGVCSTKKRNKMVVPSAFAAGLKRNGFNVLNLANNHVMDCGKEGLIETQDYLGSQEISYFGAGNNQKAAFSPLILESKGKKIAFLGMCDASSNWANNNKSGIAPLNLSRALSTLKQLRNTVDLIVVNIHADMEFTAYPSPRRVRMARQLVRAGAHLVIQHHPHICQGIEEYDEGLIAYSLGNFIFQVKDNPYQTNRSRAAHSFVLEVNIDFDKTIDNIAWKLHPVVITDDHRPRRMHESEAKAFLGYINEISTVLDDSYVLRRKWRARCQEEARTTGYAIYHTWKRDGIWVAISRVIALLKKPEERSWIVGLISFGLL